MTAEPIITRVGHVGTDELRFQGYRVFAELLGKTTFAQLAVLAISGTRISDAEAAAVDDIFAAMSSADPRLWPFKITRLAASYGSAAIGAASTLVAAEGGLYGASRMRDAGSWLSEVVARAPLSDEELAREVERGGTSFGVLYRRRDERFEALMRQIALRNRQDLPHVAMCLRVVEVARRSGNEPHVFLGVAAVALDLGLSIDAVAAVATLVLFHDAIANGVEGASQQSAVLQKLPATCIDYRGVPRRVSPRAIQALV